LATDIAERQADLAQAESNLAALQGLSDSDFLDRFSANSFSFDEYGLGYPDYSGGDHGLDDFVRNLMDQFDPAQYGLGDFDETASLPFIFPATDWDQSDETGNPDPNQGWDTSTDPLSPCPAYDSDPDTNNGSRDDQSSPQDQSPTGNDPQDGGQQSNPSNPNADPEPTPWPTPPAPAEPGGLPGSGPLAYDQGKAAGMYWAISAAKGDPPVGSWDPDYAQGFKDGAVEIGKLANAGDILAQALGLGSGGSGQAGNELGAAREKYVADQIGGRNVGGTPEAKIKTSSGSTDIDVIGPNGELIQVGGPGKAIDPSTFGKNMKVLKEYADQAGQTAQFYYQTGTPESVLNIARKWLGANNVKPFNLP
jgi:hypothetical protein